MKFYSLLVSLLLFVNFIVAQCDSPIGAIYGSPEEDEKGNSLTATSENYGFYLAGVKNDSLLILKVALTGKIEWARTFEIVEGFRENVTSIIVDSEGMIAVAGHIYLAPSVGSVFIFRYNPDSNQVLWVKEFSNTEANRSFSLIQKGIGGNYIMSNSADIAIRDGWDCELLEINKNTGDILPSFSKDYNLGSVFEWFQDLVFYKESIYGVGLLTDGGERRNALIKLNPNDGTVIWAKLGHIPPNMPARLQGTDLVIDEDEIYSIYQGDPTGYEFSKHRIFVQKTSLDGTLIWVKKYDFSGVTFIPHQMVKSGNGYVILAETNHNLILFKIDKEGTIIWSKKYEFTDVISRANVDPGTSQLIEVDNILAFTGWGWKPIGQLDMIIAITNLDGESNVPCMISTPISINVESIDNPTFYPVEPEIIEVELDVTTRISNGFDTNLRQRDECFLPDTLFNSFTKSICEGDSFEGYNEPGIYSDTFLTISGCDSIRVLNLVVLPPVTFTISKDICNGESFEGYTQSGVFIDTFPANSGCDSVRILKLNFLSCTSLVSYNLEACESYMINGTNMDYSEFLPTYPSQLNCADVTANYLFRSPAHENKHSCTPGVNGSLAMCVSAYPSCIYSAGDQASVVIEFTVEPYPDSIVRITGFEFYEKSPITYTWIDGGNGLNNYPEKYGIRILKNGNEIFRMTEVLTSITWTLQSFDFTDNDSFRIEEITTFRIELLPYCPVGNGAMVSAWDIDELIIFGSCIAQQKNDPVIQGEVITKNGNRVPNVEILLSESSDFVNSNAELTDSSGTYLFDTLQSGHAYFLKGYKNDDVRNGISTLDLIHIQSHLLGKNPFASLHEFIAADANRSGDVSTIDLLEIRKLILGIYSDFPDNTSWRFGQLLQDMSGSEISRFREVFYTGIIDKDTQVVDFVGIKIGDVNGDAQLKYHSPGIESRSTDPISFVIDFEEFKSNVPFSIHFRVSEDLSLAGMQFGLDLGSFEFVSLNDLILPITLENISFSDGIFRLCWNTNKTVHVSSGDTLFSIVLASSNECLVKQIKLLDYPKPEIYFDNLDIANLELTINQINSKPKSTNTFHIFPNPVQTEAVINFYQKDAGQVEFRFFDSSGKLISVIRKNYTIGDYIEEIKVDNFPSGIIFCQLLNTGSTNVEMFIKSD